MTVGLTVKDFVHCKRSALTKALVTRPTLVGLVLCVCVFVISQVILPSESLATDVTREGPLISVCPLVDHNIVRLGELSMTELADEPLLWSGGPSLSVIQPLVTVTWARVSLTMARVEARVKLVMTKPLLEQEGLTHLGQAGRKTRKGRNVEGGQRTWVRH